MFFGRKKYGAAGSSPDSGAASGKLDIKLLGGETPVKGPEVAPPPQQVAATPADAAATSPQIDPAMLAKISEFRAKLHETFGKVSLALMTTARYRNLPISELAHHVLDPLMRDRIAIATAAKDGAPVDGTLSGIAFWASVSEAVDVKIREQIRAGTFPVRLQAEDWNSGSINWLLDVIAPNQRLTGAVIANFRQVLPKASNTDGVPKSSEGGAVGNLHIHPIVTRLVDAETLRKLGVASIKPGNADAAAQTAQPSARGGFPKM